MHPAQAVPRPLAGAALSWPVLPAGYACASLFTLAMPADCGNLAQRRGRLLMQGLEDCWLSFEHAGHERGVQGVLWPERQTVAIHRDKHTAKLKFRQDFGCLLANGRISWHGPHHPSPSLCRRDCRYRVRVFASPSSPSSHPSCFSITSAMTQEILGDAGCVTRSRPRHRYLVENPGLVTQVTQVTQKSLLSLSVSSALDWPCAT